jgi:hypothetical protein
MKEVQANRNEFKKSLLNGNVQPTIFYGHFTPWGRERGSSLIEIRVGVILKRKILAISGNETRSPNHRKPLYRLSYPAQWVIGSKVMKRQK